MSISDWTAAGNTALAATVDRMARSFRTYGAQYAIFNDATSVTDKTINQFFDTADGIIRSGNQLLKSDAAGTMQALVGIWQIFCRRAAIPALKPTPRFPAFCPASPRIAVTVSWFDAGRAGVKLLLAAPDRRSIPRADRLVDFSPARARKRHGDPWRDGAGDEPDTPGPAHAAAFGCSSIWRTTWKACPGVKSSYGAGQPSGFPIRRSSCALGAERSREERPRLRDWTGGISISSAVEHARRDRESGRRRREVEERPRIAASLPA